MWPRAEGCETGLGRITGDPRVFKAGLYTDAGREKGFWGEEPCSRNITPAAPWAHVVQWTLLGHESPKRRVLVTTLTPQIPSKL